MPFGTEFSPHGRCIEPLALLCRWRMRVVALCQKFGELIAMLHDCISLDHCCASFGVWLRSRCHFVASMKRKKGVRRQPNPLICLVVMGGITHHQHNLSHLVDFKGKTTLGFSVHVSTLVAIHAPKHVWLTGWSMPNKLLKVKKFVHSTKPYINK